MAILCAVDDDEFSEPVVSTASDLADAFDDDLVVLHVMTEDQFETRSSSQPEYYVDEGANDAANTAETIAKRTLEETSRVVAKGRVGAPAEEISEAANRSDPRFLVLGGRKRSPVGKALFGSITQSVLLEVDAPTVTVMHD
ncbi:universal stress protein [Natronolimnohabitans innermongolicus]|uniref:UspA domain-containing protein n=1 Tax=Natronolimnohabitans innermongolicus JCM 12255 TaxID=1227499 RepID=L9WNG6_9EURY|nr:universal stress protein [Natronolimnohabitans innermongolicus]ELY50937.1 UspA domain-containing protein [Natronolimnohabitans innermongolicus JCM 12255]